MRSTIGLSSRSLTALKNDHRLLKRGDDLHPEGLDDNDGMVKVRERVGLGPNLLLGKHVHGHVVNVAV